MPAEWELRHEIDELALTSDRLRRFRERLIEMLPTGSDKIDHRESLKRMSMNSLLASYINWADRFICPRPRQTVVWDGFWKRNDPLLYAGEITNIINLSSDGADLTPYLSQQIHSDGFVPGLGEKRKGIDWRAKDRCLNAYDLHHLHLTPAGDNKRRKGSSDRLLFVGVSRSELLLLMLGDHKSFDSDELFQAVSDWHSAADMHVKGRRGLPDGSPRAATAIHGVNTFGISGDRITLPTSLVSSGNSYSHIRHADKITIALEELEPQLQLPEGLSRLQERIGAWVPDDPQWQWIMSYCDLLLLEARSQQAVSVVNWKR